MIHGAIGEVAPSAAMALLLSARSTLATAIILLVFVVIAVLVGIMPRAIATLMPWVHKAFLAGYGETNQTVLRLIVLTLAVLMADTADFILNAVAPDDIHDDFKKALNVLFYSLLIPVFFVASGMVIDWHVIRDNPLAAVAVPLIILITRGLPVFLRENSHRDGEKLSVRDRLHLRRRWRADRGHLSPVRARGGVAKQQCLAFDLRSADAQFPFGPCERGSRKRQRAESDRRRGP